MTRRISLSARWVRSVPPIMQAFLDGHAEDGPGRCWTWPGARSAGGYGQVAYYDTRRGCERTTTAHRLAYALVVGDLREGLVLDHYWCDGGARGCANPFHVREVTPRENTMRSALSAAATNFAKTHCVRGHELPPAKPGRGRSCRECARARQGKQGTLGERVGR